MTWHDNHKRLWNWLADNPMKEDGTLTGKWDWPEWDFNGGSIKAVELLCFACQGSHKCCVLIWPNEFCVGDDRNGLYNQWIKATNPTTRSRLARQIADLPLRKEKP